MYLIKNILVKIHSKVTKTILLFKDQICNNINIVDNSLFMLISINM